MTVFQLRQLLDMHAEGQNQTVLFQVDEDKDGEGFEGDGHAARNEGDALVLRLVRRDPGKQAKRWER